MERWQIEEAIRKPETERGIAAYLEIMQLFPTVNVADNAHFQRKFKGFYRVMTKSAEWYNVYFSLMQEAKATNPTFDDVLDHLWKSLGRCEPSFSSKLVATLDPEQPIWDTNVLKNTQVKCPSYSSKNKVAEAKIAYQCLVSWYQKFLDSEDGKLVVSVFTEHVKEHAKITDLKKVDFVLWQTRAIASTQAARNC